MIRLKGQKFGLNLSAGGVGGVDVCVEIIFSGKRLFTDRTAVRLLSCVHFPVSPVSRRIRKMFVADGAAERLLSRVFPHVHIETLLLEKDLLAERTDELLICRVHLPVQSVSSGCTAVRFFSCVDSFMFV